MHTGLESTQLPGAMPEGAVLTSEFFARDSTDVAADLVGKILWRVGFGGGRLSEVEAYLPVGDPASHSAPGVTRRNSAMFGAPGGIYVFLSYGVHHLLNLVCDDVNVGSAVLIRSFEPLGEAGPDGGRSGAKGPGVVGRYLGVEPCLNGRSLGKDSGVFVLDDGTRPAVGRSRRIGISKGRSCC
jgi:DNA-3-methyladenine glycosylase